MDSKIEKTKKSSTGKDAYLYAVFESGGKQHIARLGQRLYLDKLNAKAGEFIKFDKVLMLVNGDKAEFGSPYINNKPIGANVLEHAKGPKVRVIKFKRRKHHLKRANARRLYTTVEINEIDGIKSKTTTKSVITKAVKDETDKKVKITKPVQKKVSVTNKQSNAKTNTVNKAKLSIKKEAK